MFLSTHKFDLFALSIYPGTAGPVRWNTNVNPVAGRWWFTEQMLQTSKTPGQILFVQILTNPFQLFCFGTKHHCYP